MPAVKRRLIVNADDFGASHSINQAVIEAHQNGILTTASLMVNGDAAEEAVALAKENPKLGVGLHLSLICGKSALSQKTIPNLVDEGRNFSNDPVKAGMRYFFGGVQTLTELSAEISAQFERFRKTGLNLDHVNGHLHFHMHPTVAIVLFANVANFGIRQMRLTRDPLLLNARIASGRWIYRLSHSLIFTLLAAKHRKEFRQRRIKATDRVFGLLQNALVDESYVTKLLPRLPAGDSELYSHPSLDEFKNEFDALVSPRVRSLVEEEQIELIRYADL